MTLRPASEDSLTMAPLPVSLIVRISCLISRDASYWKTYREQDLSQIVAAETPAASPAKLDDRGMPKNCLAAHGEPGSSAVIRGSIARAPGRLRAADGARTGPAEGGAG